MPPLVHQPLDQAEAVVLVVDGEAPGEAEQLGLAPEQPGGERVESTDPEPRRVALEQPADPVLLEWAMESLVKNAIDALQGRSGTIILRVGATEGMGEIRVVDDGPGVAKEIRRTLFEPGITTKRGGWGIGLALARRVVEDAHRGVLALESTDRGASFLMRIPLAEPAA